MLKEEIDKAIVAIIEGVNQTKDGNAIDDGVQLQLNRIASLNLPEQTTRYRRSRLNGEADSYWDFIELLNTLVNDEERQGALESLLQLRLTDLLRWQLEKPHTKIFNLIGICVRAKRNASYYGAVLNTSSAFRDALSLSINEDPSYWLEQAQNRIS